MNKAHGALVASSFVNLVLFCFVMLAYHSDIVPAIPALVSSSVIATVSAILAIAVKP